MKTYFKWSTSSIQRQFIMIYKKKYKVYIIRGFIFDGSLSLTFSSFRCAISSLCRLWLAFRWNFMSWNCSLSVNQLHDPPFVTAPTAIQIFSILQFPILLTSFMDVIHKVDCVLFEAIRHSIYTTFFVKIDITLVADWLALRTSKFGYPCPIPANIRTFYFWN